MQELWPRVEINSRQFEQQDACPTVNEFYGTLDAPCHNFRKRLDLDHIINTGDGNVFASQSCIWFLFGLTLVEHRFTSSSLIKGINCRYESNRSSGKMGPVLGNLSRHVQTLGHRASKVIRVNWHLGVTAFGGPPVHFRIVCSHPSLLVCHQL
jgi:hypothetical protein